MASYRIFQLRRRLADSLRSNRRSEKDDEVLQAACENNVVRITQYLNESDSPLDLRTDDRRSILHLAAMEGHVAMLSLLLGNPRVKKRINTHDRANRTALHLAAAVGYDVCVRALTTACAALNEQDEEGRTPLHLAIKFAWPEAVKALLEVKADTAMEDAYGKNAVDMAHEAQDGDVSALMMPFGPSQRSMGNPLMRCFIPQRSKASSCKGLPPTNTGPRNFSPENGEEAGAAGHMTAAQERYHRKLQEAMDSKKASSTATADTAEGGATGPEEEEEEASEEEEGEEASGEEQPAPQPKEQERGDQLVAAIAQAARQQVLSSQPGKEATATEEPQSQPAASAAPVDGGAQEPAGQRPLARSSVAATLDMEDPAQQQLAPMAGSSADVKIHRSGAEEPGDGDGAAAAGAAHASGTLAPCTPRGGATGHSSTGGTPAAVATVAAAAVASPSPAERVTSDPASPAGTAAETGASGAAAAVVPAAALYEPPPCTAVFLVRAHFGEEVKRLEFEVEWSEEGPVVGNVSAGGAAAKRGLQEGDCIVELNGQSTSGKGRPDLLPLLKARPLLLEVNRSAEVLDAQRQPHIELVIAVAGTCDDRGFDVGCFGQVPAVCTVRPNSSAYEAGLLEGDAIVAANGCRAGKSSQAALLAEFRRRPLQLTVWRRPLGEELTAPWALDPNNAHWCEMPSKTVRGGDLTDSDDSGDEAQ